MPELRSQGCRLRRWLGVARVVSRLDGTKYSLRASRSCVRAAGGQGQLLLKRKVHVQEVALVLQQRQPRQGAVLGGEEGGVWPGA